MGRNVGQVGGKGGFYFFLSDWVRGWVSARGRAGGLPAWVSVIMCDWLSVIMCDWVRVIMCDWVSVLFSYAATYLFQNPQSVKWLNFFVAQNQSFVA